MKRFEKYLLEENEVPKFDDFVSEEGLNIVPTNISVEEQCKYQIQCRVFEAVFHTLCELFEIDNMELQVTGFSISFCLIVKPETDFNSQQVFESPELSREKLKGIDTKELSGVIIDMIRSRKTWIKEKSYRTLHLD